MSQPLHPRNGGFYRWVDSFDVPWVPSPIIHEPFDGFPWNPTWVHRETQSERTRRLGIRSKRKSLCGLLRSCLKDLLSASRDIWREARVVTQVSDEVLYNHRRGQPQQREASWFHRFGSWTSIYIPKFMESVWLLGSSNCQSGNCP